MNSSRRAALSLGLIAFFGGGLLLSFRAASGQSVPASGPPSSVPASGPPSGSPGGPPRTFGNRPPGVPGPGVPTSGAPGTGVPPSGAPGMGVPASGPPRLGVPTSGAPGASGVTPSIPGATGTFDAGVGTSTTGTAAAPTSPVLSQTVGISPAQPVHPVAFKVFGGTGEGGESYDLQTQNVYSLLQQAGVPIKNVLHPDSTAKPSFIVERLIVLSASGGSGGQGNSQSSSSSSASGSGSGSGSGSSSSGGATTTQAQGPTDAQRTITAVRHVVEAEISRGSGRIGGNHRRKLQLLRDAIVSIEKAGQGDGTVSSALGGASDARGSSSSGAGNGQGQGKFDPRELYYGEARRYARQADQLAPKGF